MGRQEIFGVIYADPPWRFEPYTRDTGMDRAADNHYPTMTLDEIKALDVPSIAAEDCVLFLWATAPMLPQALEVMTAWGFTYKIASHMGQRRGRPRLLVHQPARAPSGREQGQDPRARAWNAVALGDRGSGRQAFRQA